MLLRRLGGRLLFLPQLLPQVPPLPGPPLDRVLGAGGRVGTRGHLRELRRRQLDRFVDAPDLGRDLSGRLDAQVGPVRVRLGQPWNESL